MKRFFLLLFLPLAACSGPADSSHKLTLESGDSFPESAVVLTRAQLAAKTGPIAADQYVQLSNVAGALPIQYDDLDGDGQWDEIVFWSAWPAELSLSLGATPAPQPTPFRTNLRMAKVIEKDVRYEELQQADRIQGTTTAVTIAQFQYEGPGWENDRVAFRNYFDERNGIDIFGKQVAEMVLDSVGIIHNYHELRDWGMDILKVGNSLGAGGIGLFYEDSLYRVTAASGCTYRALIEGPLRSVFEMGYPVQIGGQTVQVTHHISILAGMNGYASEVSVSPVLPGLQLAAGIVNLETEEYFESQASALHTLYTYGGQAYDGENLGMGVISLSTDFQQVYTSPEEGEGVIQTYSSLLALHPDQPTPYFFAVAWEKTDPAYQQIVGFEAMLQSEGPKWQRLVLGE